MNTTRLISSITPMRRGMMLALPFHSGVDYREIAAQIKIPKATVGRICKTSETEATAALAERLGR